MAKKNSKRVVQGVRDVGVGTHMEEAELPRYCAPDSRHSAPSLVFFHGKQGRWSQTFFNLTEGRSYVSTMREFRNYVCWGTSQGWLMLLDPTSGHCFLFNPATMAKIELPTMEKGAPDIYSKCILSSSPTDPSCVVLCIDVEASYFMFCHPGDKIWIWHEYELEQNDCLYDVVYCNGRFCANTLLKNNLVLLDLAPEPKITVVEVEYKSVLGPEGLLGYSSSLVESYGEIFLVVRHLIKYTEETVELEILRMDWSVRRWEAVDDIGDRVFFVNNFNYCSASWCASELGLKKGCIYFLRPISKQLYVYDMEEGTITCSLPCPNVKNPWSGILFLMPTL